MTTLMKTMEQYREDMQEWFADLHQNPEPAFGEQRTSARIADLLESWGYQVARGVGGTGVVATLSAGDGPCIGLRADMDALPMDEGAGAPGGLRSQVPGFSHMCGHDGHCTMLLGAAKHLAATRAFKGTLCLVFQPAEEIMGGALAMMRDGLLERFPMQAMFAMHNIPGLEQGKFYFRSGPLFTSVDNWEIQLTGKGVHGSMPDKGIDPVVAGSSLVMELQTIVSRNVSPSQTAVVTVGCFQAGEVGNIIPQTATLKLSVRSAEPEVRELVLDRIRAITAAVATLHGCGYQISEGQPGAVLVNDAELKERAFVLASNALGDDRCDPQGPRQMPSEDFAFYAQHVPVFYALVGNGDTQMNHHPDYAFNQENLVPGAAYWVALAEGFLQ